MLARSRWAQFPVSVQSTVVDRSLKPASFTRLTTQVTTPSLLLARLDAQETSASLTKVCDTVLFTMMQWYFRRLKSFSLSRYNSVIVIQIIYIILLAVSQGCWRLNTATLKDTGNCLTITKLTFSRANFIDCCYYTIIWRISTLFVRRLQCKRQWQVYVVLRVTIKKTNPETCVRLTPECRIRLSQWRSLYEIVTWVSIITWSW